MADAIKDLVGKAIVAACDTRAGVVALTGRARQNVVPWEDSAPVTLPRVAYLVTNAVPLTTRQWRVDVGFAAIAKLGGDATCHALLKEIAAGVDAVVLGALDTPLDAIVTAHAQPFVAAEDDQARADLMLTLLVWT